MKRNILVVVLLFILVCSQLSLIIAQEDSAENFQEGIEDLRDKQERVEDIKEDIVEGEWDYLGKEWQKIFLGNPIVSTFDNSFKKISFIFRIFFGEPYSLSLALFLVMVLWLYFFLKFKEMMQDYSLFSKKTSWVFGIAMPILLAQMGFLRAIIEFFGWLVFSKEANLWRFLIMLVIVVVMVVIYKLTSKFGEAFKANREVREVERNKTERRSFHDFFETLMKTFAGDEK